MFGVSKEIWDGYSAKEKLYVFLKRIHLLKVAQFFNRKRKKWISKNQGEQENIYETKQEVIPEMPKEKVVPKEKTMVKEEIKGNGAALLSNNPEGNLPLQKDIILSEERQWERLEQIFQKSKEQFYQDVPSKKRKVVFSGHILEFDKGICKYINRLDTGLKDTEVLLISHATNQHFFKSNGLIKTKYFSLPYTFGVGRYEKGIKVIVPEEIISLVQEKEYLKLHEEKIRLRHKDMGEGYPLALTWFLFNYYCEFLDYYKPDAVILWCEFYCGHSMLKDICEEKGIKVLYMEFGALPGTVALENNGQMGESDVAVNWEEFKKKAVSEKEVQNAREILKYLKESGLNRRVQPKTNVAEDFKKKYNPTKPIVVMFGQNDYESGIKPYTDKSKKYHSPSFEGSDDAALFVEKLAKKNGWNYIYKPHQMMVRVGECLEEGVSPRTMWVGDSDINELIDMADVVITIVSQCGYVSLIREKPTVMLGYTQLRGKDCAYEAFDKDDVETVIKEALRKGYTDQQKSAFEKHVAQLMKYYLYDDGLSKKYQIGQDPQKAIEFVNENVGFDSDRTYEKRDILFFCETAYDIQSAITLRENFNKNSVAVIYVLNDRDTVQASDIIRFADWSKVVVCKDLSKIIEEMEGGRYTDLYLPGYQESHLQIFRIAREQNSDLNVHIYDGGNIQLYLHDIARDMSSKSMRPFFARVSDIYLYDRDFMVWKEKINIRFFAMPCSDKKYIQYVLSACMRKIYMCSFLMKEGYASNEMDLINEVEPDKGKITIVPFDRIDEEMFINRSYQIERGQTKSEREKERKIIFSTMFSGAYYLSNESDKYSFIDLSNFIISGYQLLNSNTYKQFQQICNKKVKQNLNYFMPKSLEELRYVISVLEREN